jgi:hypothetical protein
MEFENRAQRRLFGPTKVGVTRGWRELHYEAEVIVCFITQWAAKHRIRYEAPNLKGCGCIIVAR